MCKWLPILLWCGFFITAYSQERTDTQAWGGVSLTLDLPKKWTATVQYRNRFINNVSYYKGSYLFAATEYEFQKNMELTVNYRLALVDVGTFHRFFVGVASKTKIGNFTFKLRPAFQYQNQRFAGDDEVRLDADAYFRPRGTIKYKINKKWDIYTYIEPFYAFKPSGMKIDNWQNSIGLKYEFRKNQHLNPYFVWQPDYGKKRYTQTNFIFGLDTEFSIKPFKKKKKNKKGVSSARSFMM
ncbi:MAG: DUF2490 domain-containing protein [Runella sp.]